MNAVEIETLVGKAEDKLKNLYDRMDADYGLWKLKQVVYETHKTAINVTLNDPRTAAEFVQSALSAAEMQIMVRMAEESGEDKREDIGKLEKLLHFSLQKADERLIRLILPPLKETLIWQSTIRGWKSARILVYKTKDGVIFNFMPYDPRWLTYEVGYDGLKWTAYKTFRSGASIKAEYGRDVGDEESLPVIDWWEVGDSIQNGVICDREFLKPLKKYDIPSIPVLIMPVGTNPPVITEIGDEVEFYGESMYAANRDTYGMDNRLVSMWATHANLLAKQPTLNYYDEQGKILKSTAYLADGVVNLPKGHNELMPSPMKEISPTLVNLVGLLGAKRQHGDLPDIEYGQLQSMPLSGTAINELQQAVNKVTGPHIRGLNYFYADICRLIEEQLLAGKLKVEVKGEVKGKYYETKVTPVDLKKPHVITVEFTARTPWTQLDTYQLADMAKRLGLPDAFIHEYILKIPDPKGVGDLSAIEVAEHSPKGMMVRAIQALIKAGRHEEASGVMEDLYNMTMQEQMGGQSDTVGAGQAGMAP